MTKQPEALRLADALDGYEWTAVEDMHIAAAELRRLHQFELAFTKYLEKTEWVQETAKPHELGMDRADVLKQRIDCLHEVNQMLLGALKWMVENDDTNEGDEPVDSLGGQSWNEHNEYWICGLNKARAAIEKAGKE